MKKTKITQVLTIVSLTLSLTLSNNLWSMKRKRVEEKEEGQPLKKKGKTDNRNFFHLLEQRKFITFPNQETHSKTIRALVKNKEYQIKKKILIQITNHVREEILKTIFNDLNITYMHQDTPKAMKKFNERFNEYLKNIKRQILKKNTLNFESKHEDEDYEEDELGGPYYILQSFRFYPGFDQKFLEQWVTDFIIMFIEVIMPIFKIDTINMVGNELKEIPERLMNALIAYEKDIKELNLSFNKIKRIPDEIEYLQSLEEINLDENELECPSLALLVLPHLKDCFLTVNPYIEHMHDDDKIPRSNGELTNVTLLEFRNQLISNLEKNNNKYHEIGPSPFF